MKNRNKKPDPWQSEVDLWPERHREWAARASVAMVLYGAEDAAAASKMAEVRQSVEASGQTPAELFGKPEAFGRATGKQLRPPVEVLENDLMFRSVAGGMKVMLLGLGMLLIVLGLWVGLEDGWNGRSAQLQLMVLFPLLTAFFALGIWGWVLRTRGNLGASLVAWIVALAGFLGSTALMAVLPDSTLGRPPNWGIPLYGVAFLVVGFLVRERPQRALEDDSNWDDARWFMHAENLLRGRYLFSRTQAVEALREARDHRSRTGSTDSLASEFGNVEVFSAQLAATNLPAIRRGVIAKRVGILAVLAFFAVFFVFARVLEDGLTWQSSLNIAVLVVATVVVVRSWKSQRINADAKQLKKRRMAQARALGSADDC